LLGDSLLYAVLPSQAARLGIPLALVGLLLSANRLIRLVTNSWAGAVYSRRARQGPFLAAMVGATLTTFSYALPWGFWPFLVARVVWGTCWSFLRMGQMLAVLQTAGVHDRGLWLGRMQAVARIGTIFSLFLGGYLTDRAGYAPTVTLFGVLTAAGAGLAWREWTAARRWRRLDSPTLREPEEGHPSKVPAVDPCAASFVPRPEEACPNRHGQLPTVPGASASQGSSAVAEATTSQTLLTYVAGFAQGFTTFGIIMGTLSLLLLQRFGEHVTVLGAVLGVATVSGALLGVRWIVELLLAPGSGRLADRLGRGRAAAVGALVQAAMLVTVVTANRVELIFLAACGLFAGAVLYSVSLDAAAADLAAATGPTKILSRYATAQDVGAALGPALGYALSGVVGLSSTYASVAATLVVLAGALARWSRR